MQRVKVSFPLDSTSAARLVKLVEDHKGGDISATARLRRMEEALTRAATAALSGVVLSALDPKQRARQRNLYYWRAVRASRAQMETGHYHKWPEFWEKYKKANPMPSIEEMLREINPNRICTECGATVDVGDCAVHINKRSGVCRPCHAANPQAGRKVHKPKAPKSVPSPEGDSPSIDQGGGEEPPRRV